MKEYTYLYIEDDPLSCQVMRMMLEQGLGITNLIVFNDSDHFVERLKTLSVRPDFILMDINIKPLNGFQMMKLLRQDPVYDDTRVIALTAGVLEELPNLRMAGFNGAIAKPLSMQTFPDLVMRAAHGETIWHIV